MTAAFTTHPPPKKSSTETWFQGRGEVGTEEGVDRARLEKMGKMGRPHRSSAPFAFPIRAILIECGFLKPEMEGGLC
jgi:hypothetical protein